jgi:pimeloyl-ACP methyl ester carboxylesterase
VVALSEIPVPESRSGSGLFDNGPAGALRVPTTVVYAAEDMAFEQRLVLDGIADYLPKRSQVLYVEGVAHWLPHSEVGREVLEGVVEWAMGDEGSPLKQKFDTTRVKSLVEQ